MSSDDRKDPVADKDDLQRAVEERVAAVEAAAGTEPVINAPATTATGTPPTAGNVAPSAVRTTADQESTASTAPGGGGTTTRPVVSPAPIAEPGDPSGGPAEPPAAPDPDPAEPSTPQAPTTTSSD